MTKRINKLFYGGAFLASLLFIAACEPAPSMMNKSSTPTPLPPAETGEKLTGLEREIKDMETAGFKIIYVIKRKDGGVLSREDKNHLSANRPREANRFVLTDDEKAIVAGSNFPFSTENLEAIRKRFVVEDYSKPDAPTPVSGNTNSQ
jgi:poly(3-hydroxybutyrate) depolymerase